MKLSTVQDMFSKKYPNGEIRWHRRRTYDKANGFEVFYGRGKWYHYRDRTLVAISVRLGLIPEIDMCAVADRVAHALLSEQADVVDYEGACDTIRHLHPNLEFITSEYHSKDEYGRQLYRYYLGLQAEADLWSSTLQGEQDDNS